MATLVEQYNLAQSSDLRNKVAAAARKKAQLIAEEATPDPTHVQWAIRVYRNSDAEAEKILPFLIAKHSLLTEPQIRDAADVDIQTAVDQAMTLFAKAEV